MPSSQIAGFGAVIAILSAIIIGYATYRLIMYYRDHGRGRPRTYPNRYRKGTRIGEIAIPGHNYSHLPPLASGRSNERLTVSSPQPLPPSSSAAILTSSSGSSFGGNGGKTPKLEWRPPPLTPWMRSFKSSRPDQDAELGRVQELHSEAILFPPQAYPEQGKSKEKIRMKFGLGFRIGKGGKEGDAYLMVGGSPPVGSSPPRYIKGTESPLTPVSAGRATSPPLPPLPSPTTLDHLSASVLQKPAGVSRVSQEPSNPVAPSSSYHEAGPPSNPPTAPIRTPSRPPSRVPTVKGSRLTSTTIASNFGRISTVIVGPTPNPSPRVSSLYHSRNSGQSYTPASPGLPNPLPPIPPVPALPAHLPGRALSVKTMRTETDSLGSIPGHGQEQDIANPAAGTTGVQAGPLTSPSTQTKGLDGKPLPRTMVVTATFTPSLSDELPLTIGETVSMLEEYIDGWCFVQRVKILVKPGASQAINAGIMVSVHGTIDTSNTIAVPVEGEGNSGAIPRFCVSEWPLAASTIAQLQQVAGTAQQSKHQEAKKEIQDACSASPPSFLPSVQIDLDVAAKVISPRETPLPPPPPSYTLRLPEPLQAHELLESKFSSWGSIPATGTVSHAMVPSKKATQPGPIPSNGRIEAPPITSPVSELTPSFVTSTQAMSSSMSLDPAPSTLLKTASIVNAAESRTASRATSTMSDASYPAPAPPPTSPVSVVQSSLEAPEEGIKRVSKPPPAPRLSRFPSPKRDSVEVIPDPTVPKASDRTMTMPPSTRGISLADTLTIDNYPSMVYQGLARSQAGAASVNRMDSSASTWIGSGSGTSAGSKTPSTAQSTLTDKSYKSSMSKRFTSAMDATSSGSASSASIGGRAPSNTIATPSAMVPRLGASPSAFGPRAQPGGLGMVSFKALRTGSTTATPTRIPR